MEVVTHYDNSTIIKSIATRKAAMSMSFYKFQNTSVSYKIPSVFPDQTPYLMQTVKICYACFMWKTWKSKKKKKKKKYKAKWMWRAIEDTNRLALIELLSVIRVGRAYQKVL